uniref:HAT C-terminal dimerisation domain-containing protein n=1 Tax=Aplanochytrium stocchinoi TaxID=215587 RepID=A0A6S8BUV8_9STRA|eukprot:CAMPEP_0204843414 /NCGR_PEP_ID=MMETSP1346-20131115/47966_1 /ASSEMBLY_ACC=CAM_ASM_000771 /TAXON_ID=215587 /ORGANISM="Aplanochytrium stocchinoi, Strain GSBS06" /LENGTH=860 /DNA_ID=CAMNT_0051982553 /DNA_START=27 /DNA_END=2609 /DNA_ORIENTATION=-
MAEELGVDVAMGSAFPASEAEKAYKFKWKSSKSGLWLHGDTTLEEFDGKQFKNEKSLKSMQKKVYDNLKKTLGQGSDAYTEAMHSTKRYTNETGQATAWKFIKRLNMPHFNERGTICTHVCIICDADPDCTWDDALVAVFHKGNKDGNAVARSGAGPNAHLQSHHKQIFNQGVATFKAMAGTKRKADSGGKVTKRKNLKFLETHIAMVDVAIETKLPLSIVEHPSMVKLMERSTRERYSKIWRGRSDRILEIKYARTIQTIKNMIKEAKLYYSSVLKKGETPVFVSCTYDKSNLDEGIAVEVSFVNPVDFKLHRVAIGMPTPINDQDTQVKANVNALLDKLGIPDEIVMISEVEDRDENYVPFTFAQGVSEERGAHVIATLTEKALTVDCPEVAKLLEKANALTSYFLDVKNPERWTEYVNTCRSNKYDVGSIFNLDKKDGVFGVYSFIQMLLKQYHCMKAYFSENSLANKRKQLTEDEWKACVEVEALLRPIIALCKEVDRDATVTAGIAWFYVKRAKVLCSSKLFKFVDLSDVVEAWDSTKEFDQLTFVDGEIDGRAASELQQVLANFEDSLPGETEDSLVAMVCDPIVNTVGRSWMKHDVEDGRVWDKAVEAFKEAFHAEAEKGVPPNTQSLPEAPEAGTGATVAGASDWEARTRQAVTEAIEASNQNVQPEEELNRYLNLKENWLTQYKSQNPRAINDDLSAKLGDPLYVSTKVDCLKWWRTHKSEYPTVARLAARYLAIRPETGFEEKVFRTSSTNDIKTYKRWFGDRKFEYFQVMHHNAKWARTNLSLGDIVKDIQNPAKITEVVKILDEFSGQEKETAATMQLKVKEFSRDIQMPDYAEIDDVTTSSPKKSKN